MLIDFEERDGIIVISPEGRIDANNAPFLKDQFQLRLKHSKFFVFDLAKVDFIDSTGLGALVACLKYAGEESGDVVVANLQPKPRMVFEITRAYKIFEIYDNLEMAVQHYL